MILELTGKLRYIKHPNFDLYGTLILQQEWIDKKTGKTKWINVPIVD